MAKNILVISTSLRENSNTDILADEFIKGAKESGHNVEKISLKNKKINFCTGCNFCQTTGKCVFNDDATKIISKMHDSDILVFAAPVYFGGISGIFQTLMDRTSSMLPFKSNRPQNHKFKEVYLLTASAEGNTTIYTDLVVNKVKNWVQHFDGTCMPCENKAEFKGVVCGLGCCNAGDIKQKYEILKQAYNMGKNIK